MKRFICTVFSALALCALIIFSGCSEQNNYGETFKGYLSESAYTSENAAVNAFLEEQLNGTTAECTLGNYTLNGVLTEREIDELEINEKIYSANYLTVYYTDGNLNDRKASLYVVRSADGFRYFAPLPQTGEAVTAGYYNSVLSNKAYNNCTVNTTYSGHFYSTETTYLQTFKFDYTKAYFKQTIPTMKVDFFMEQTPNGFEYYSKLPLFGDDNYYNSEETNRKIKEEFGEDYYFYYVLLKGGKEYRLDSFSDISELSTFIYAADYDCSYFVKTDYGFCMPFDKFKQAVYSAAAMLGSDAEEIELDINRHIAYFDVRYYVSEGRLSKIDYTLQAIVSDDPKDLLSIEMHSMFTDFGTTEVKLPV